MKWRNSLLEFYLSFKELILLLPLLSIKNFIRGGAIIAYKQNKIINISIGKRFIYLPF